MEIRILLGVQQIGRLSRKILGTGSALEMRRSLKGCAGSNPASSAKIGE